MVFFLVSGICLIAIAVVLNISWVFLSIREVALLVVGIIFFAVIITGLTLNTIFLVREVRRNERHDAFLNAVTHELKTPSRRSGFISKRSSRVPSRMKSVPNSTT